MRKTKIVCTVGPATDSIDVLRDLMKSGMNVARFNFSHGDYETQKRRFDMVCRLRNELGLPIATMLDTKGPEVRLGKFENDEPVKIQDGDTYTLTTRDILCNTKEGCVSFKRLPHDISAGNRILINDGVVELLAEKVTETDIICRIIHGGVLSNNKGINVPGVKLSMPFLSDADMNDLEFGAKQGFDFIAASFVRTAADINYLRKFTQSLGWFDVRIIAKIENLEGVENIDEILEAADGIMVARGDMGVEIPFEQIPSIQKDLIHKGYNAGKQVITATQMLESMINNPRPTRAEITDVANAIYDGTSAIMLSGETAAGKYPVETVATMARIAKAAEEGIEYDRRYRTYEFKIKNTVDAISHGACGMAIDIGAKAIAVCSLSGMTARMVSRFRSPVDILGITTSEKTWRKLALSWGVTPVMCETLDSTEVLFYSAKRLARKMFDLKQGDRIVITAGATTGRSGNTNLIKIETV